MPEVGSSESHNRTKTDRKAISSELLARFEAEGEAFLSLIVTTDETWVHRLNRRQNGAGQGMVPTRHTCTCLSLTEGYRGGKIGV
jgi:hypothetical protein